MSKNVFWPLFFDIFSKRIEFGNLVPGACELRIMWAFSGYPSQVKLG